MSMEKIDYAVILADAEAKIAALQELVNSLKKAAALGALSQLGEGIPSNSRVSSEPVDLPVGAFSDQSVPAAIKMYLGAVKKKQTGPQIVAALKDGGMESTSSNFYTVVAGALHRLKLAGDVLRFKDGWGLASLYPEHIRKAAVQEPAARKKPKKGPKTKAKVKADAPKAKPASSVVVPLTTGVEQQIANLLKNGKRWSPGDIAKTLDLNATGVKLTLGRMAAKHTTEKCPDGTYRTVGESQKAG